MSAQNRGRLTLVDRLEAGFLAVIEPSTKLDLRYAAFTEDTDAGVVPRTKVNVLLALSSYS